MYLFILECMMKVVKIRVVKMHRFLFLHQSSNTFIDLCSLRDERCKQ